MIGLLGPRREAPQLHFRTVDRNPRPQHGGARQVLGQGLLLGRIEEPVVVAIEGLPQRPGLLAGAHLVVRAQRNPRRREPQRKRARMRNVVRQRRSGQQEQPGPPHQGNRNATSITASAIAPCGS